MRHSHFGNTLVQVSLTILPKIFGVPRPPTPLAYLIHHLTLEQKDGMVVQQVHVLARLFATQAVSSRCPGSSPDIHFNILPTTKRSVLTDNTSYLIDGILNNEQIDLPAILCHTMIRTHEVAHSTGSLPYPTIITQLLQVTKVPFLVVPQGCKAGKTVGHGTLRKMSLINKAIGFTVGPSRAYTASTRTSTMTLLHTLIRKVSKLLKNQKTLASNQKQLVVCYNAKHAEHPIHLGSLSGSNSGPEVEAEFMV